MYADADVPRCASCGDVVPRRFVAKVLRCAIYGDAHIYLQGHDIWKLNTQIVQQMDSRKVMKANEININHYRDMKIDDALKSKDNRELR